jgi:hypothetical protein
MRNLPQKILLPQQEAQLQQHKLEQMLRLREQQQQELREPKVQMDYLAAADKVDKVDKWADKAVAVDKVVKVVAAVAKVVKADKVVAAVDKVVKADKVVAAVDKADKVDRVAE